MIFISYRRTDAEHLVGPLYDTLARAFPKAAVFLDTDRLEGGLPFPGQLRQQLHAAEVVVVVIAKTWATVADDAGQLRLHKPGDWVRTEVELALTLPNVKRVIPLLVAGTSMPKAEDLPATIRTLTDRHALPYRFGRDRHADMLGLIDEIAKVVPGVVRPSELVAGRFNLPPVTANFVGREDEIAAMAAALRGGAAVGVTAVRGMGGVGKTSLAVRVAHEVAADFPDAHVLVDMQGTSPAPTPPEQALARIVQVFEPTAKLPDALPDLQAAARTVLRDRRALILLDNAASAAQVNPVLDVDTRSAFLVTSRKAFNLARGRMIPLDVLSEADALRLLRDLIGDGRGTDAELRTVVGLTGRLPLAVTVAGKFLQNRPGYSLERYIRAVADERTRLKKPQFQGDEDRENVGAVLALSAAELVRSDPDRAARWQVLSVFPADFAPDAAAAVWGLDEDAAFDELAELERRSLVQDVGDGRYDLHDLMRPIAREVFDYAPGHPKQADSPERIAEAERRFVAHYHVVLKQCGEIEETKSEGIVESLVVFDREVTNIRHGQSLAMSWFRADVSDQFAAQMCKAYALSGVRPVDLRLHPRERIDWLENSLNACGRLGDKASEGATLSNLGAAWTDLGDTHRATRCYEQALTIVREIGDRRGEGQVLCNLGSVWAQLGDARKALMFYEQNLVIAREVESRRGEGRALSGIALCYDALGEYWKAIGFHDQHLVIARETGDRLSEGHALHNIGGTWAFLGDAHKARECHEQSLAIAREIGDRRGEGRALIGLGFIWARLGDAHRARVCYEQSLGIARDAGDRWLEARASWNLAVVVYFLGEPTEAISNACHALSIFEVIEDPNAEKVRRKLAEWRGEA